MAESSILTTVARIMPLETAMEQAETLFASAADRMFRLLRIGMRLH